MSKLTWDFVKKYIRYVSLRLSHFSVHPGSGLQYNPTQSILNSWYQHRQHLIHTQTDQFLFQTPFVGCAVWCLYGLYYCNTSVSVEPDVELKVNTNDNDEDLRGNGPLSSQQQCHICMNMACIEEFCGLGAHIFGIRYTPFWLSIHRLSTISEDEYMYQCGTSSEVHSSRNHLNWNDQAELCFSHNLSHFTMRL